MQSVTPCPSSPLLLRSPPRIRVRANLPQRSRGDHARPGRRKAEQEAAEAAVTALYAEHAIGLIRLAQVILGDRAAAEDVVQEAFAGLFRRWAALR